MMLKDINNLLHLLDHKDRNPIWILIYKKFLHAIYYYNNTQNFIDTEA